MYMMDIGGDIPNFFFLPKRIKCTGRGGAQQFQTPEQAQTRVPVILRALAATAVGAVVFEETVDRVRGLYDYGAARFFGGRQGKRAQEDVLRTPYGPVAHGFVTAAHPPEMGGAVRRQDASFYLVLYARADGLRQ